VEGDSATSGRSGGPVMCAPTGVERGCFWKVGLTLLDVHKSLEDNTREHSALINLDVQDCALTSAWLLIILVDLVSCVCGGSFSTSSFK
jgi:hypothetical protein